MKLLKNNPAMIATLISGLLILLGWILKLNAQETIATFIFLTSFIIGGFKQAKEGFIDTYQNKHLNVDILMVLAAIGASIIGYWMEGALLIFIFSLSGSLEEYATNKSTEAIASLMHMQPETALKIQKDGSTKEVSIKSLAIGDSIFVPKGASIPIDGIIEKGNGIIDEAAISGEPLPVEKSVGDPIFGGTINLYEGLTFTVSKDVQDTLFSKIIRLVEEAQNTPSKTATLIKKIESTYVKIVLTFVPIMIAIFYFGLHWGWNESFYRGMVLLVVASPCALVASATPATLAAISNGAKHGILFKGGAHLENFSQIKAIAFDKTGTLTQGMPVVTDSYFTPECTTDETINAVIAMEKTSTHPLAKAIVNFLEPKMTESIDLQFIKDQTGHGLACQAYADQWKIGKKEYIGADIQGNSVLFQEAELLQKQGKTVVYITRNAQTVGYLGLLDVPKSDAKEMIAFFKKQNIQTIMITGDNEATGQTIGKQLGLDKIYANCLPETKTTIIADLKEEYGMIAMVGDGINDAPALASAAIGIAMGAGTDIAMDVADVVLMKNELNKLNYSYELSKKLKKITIQNMIFSITIISVLILSNLFQLINLPLGVIGHEGSTILVILNGLRLLRPMKSHPTRSKMRKHSSKETFLTNSSTK